MTDTFEPSPVWRQQHRLHSCTRPSRAHSASSSSSYASDADSSSFSGSNDDASPVSVQTSVTSHVGSPASGKARYAGDAGPPLLEEPAAKKCRLDSSVACVRDAGDAPAPKPDEADANTTARLNRALYVENLVHAAVAIISSIWGRFSRESRGQDGAGSALPLDTFVREILRRSRTSCSTLQTALLYCDRCRDVVQSSVDRSLQAHGDERRHVAGLPESQSREGSSTPESDSGSSSSTLSSLPSLSPPSAYFYASHASQGSKSSQLNASMCAASPLLCGRRMFLAAIMVASKFLQDRTYSNRAWSKISGLPSRELEQLERVFLHSIQYNLVVDLSEWSQWIRELVTSRATMAAVRNQGLRRAMSENVLGQAVPHDVAIGQKRDAKPQDHTVARINFVRNGSFDTIELYHQCIEQNVQSEMTQLHYRAPNYDRNTDNAPPLREKADRSLYFYTPSLPAAFCMATFCHCLGGASGWTVVIIRTEWTLYVFDGAFVLLAVIILNCYRPGLYLPTISHGIIIQIQNPEHLIKTHATATTTR